MISIASHLLTALAALLVIPSMTLFLELAGALLFTPHGTRSRPRTGERPRVAVLIPAHNESAAMRPTLGDIGRQLKASDRLVVVADNCSDDTAVIAADAGAEVVERTDSLRVGKGYALDFGLRHLSLDPPQVVIVVDADCRVAEGTIERLATTCADTGRPTQALDLMTAPSGSGINFRVAEFAWRVKNWVRPLGLAAFHLPCQLMGTGMALPWVVIRSIELATGSLVEDLALGLNMSAIGHAPLFCPAALVTSQFPLSAEGATSQRYRWEQGHIHLIITTVPRYLAKALAGGNLPLLVLTLDLAVPPMSLLMILLVAMLALTGLAALVGLSAVALIITAVTFSALMAMMLVVWWQFGRDLLSFRSSVLVGSYVAAKLPMYFRALLGNITAKWIRTDRKNPR